LVRTQGEDGAGRRFAGVSCAAGRRSLLVEVFLDLAADGLGMMISGP